MTSEDRILYKLSSGQFILTVSCAFVFAWVSINGLLPSEAVASILTAVFVHYFRRDRNENKSKDSVV